MRILLRMSGPVLDKGTTEVRQQFFEFVHFQPGFPPKLLTAVDSKNDMGSHAMASQPGKNP